MLADLLWVLASFGSFPDPRLRSFTPDEPTGHSHYASEEGESQECLVGQTSISNRTSATFAVALLFFAFGCGGQPGSPAAVSDPPPISTPTPPPPPAALAVSI